MVRAIEIGVAQAAEIAKPSAMEHTGGFAFVPQDRAVSPTQHRQGYRATARRGKHSAGAVTIKPLF
jgi:hypothetical protein